MGKLVPVLLALIGLGAGVGGGMAMRQDPTEMVAEVACAGQSEAKATEVADKAEQGKAGGGALDYVKLNNQFVIPVVNQGSVSALVVISLSLELASGGPELVYKREPKLRDAFLQVLFNHANTGGFDGNFTSGRSMGQLRAALLESAQKTLGSSVTNVLIVDVIRQDT